MAFKVATNFNKRRIGENMNNFITENTTPVNAAVEAQAESKDPAREYRIKLVNNLVEHAKKRNELSDKFDELFGGFLGNGDSYYSRFVGDLFDDQIELVAEIIGDTKEGLEWFIYDNECGEKGLEAGGVGGILIKINTIDDYIGLVELFQNVEPTSCSSPA